jgi:hypothetical protein
MSADDFQALANPDDCQKEEDDDDDDDDLEEGAEDIEAQKQRCMKDPEANNGAEEEAPPQNVSRFDHKQKKGFVDVWWLFDDGGRFNLFVTSGLWS